jgi:putative ABC transport system ATP-binding protein
LLLADEPTGNLDSTNGDSVMQLLSELNEQGVTICMVTHDSRYAHFAKRTINLFDGKVVKNSNNEQSARSHEQLSPHHNAQTINEREIGELLPKSVSPSVSATITEGA